ncbi:4'-phosphopantetheinyl transferase family protein [Streptomyces sp. NPDC048603]|uniref:4'-phosphopantetheinyl transferase family protein n=1 Tax=Streptomyces sp. NPDC048603 TaxID=3365577 RepID=UPI003717CC25
MIEYVNQLGPDVPRAGAFPSGRDVSVWYLDTTLAVVGGVDLADAASVLDGAELARAERLVRPGHRQRFLASHLGLRVLLGRYLGVPPREVGLDREDCHGCGEPHGRPVVAGGTGPHFSLSHSEDTACLAFAGVPVGVDVEALPKPAAVHDVLHSLHPRETAELTALPEPDRPAALGRIWSRKEACLKATGAGLTAGLAEPYVGSAPAPAPVPGWTLTDLPSPPGYFAALALAAG